MENDATETKQIVGVSGFIEANYITKILQSAAQYGHINTFKYLINKELITNYYLHCYEAAKNNQLNIVKYLWENYRDDITHLGNTALHTAVDSGANLEIIEYLISNGVDIKATNDKGETVLFQAIYAERTLDIIEYLVRQGANVMAPAKNDMMVLDVAMARNLDVVVRYLKTILENRRNIEEYSEQDSTESTTMVEVPTAGNNVPLAPLAQPEDLDESELTGDEAGRHIDSQYVG